MNRVKFAGVDLSTGVHPGARRHLTPTASPHGARAAAWKSRHL